MYASVLSLIKNSTGFDIAGYQHHSTREGTFIFVLLNIKIKRSKVMKKILNFTLVLTLVLSLALSMSACSLFGGEKDASEAEGVKTYYEDTTLGEGSKTVTVRIEDPEKSVTFTIHTDKSTVGDALVEHGIISGDEEAYGLYVKVANGKRADFERDGAYWAFYVDDDYAMSGVDLTDIEEGVLYRLVYTK